ncbi:hypothetical protein ACSX1C_06980 [Pseudomonas sp. MBLB4123]|uniref:hypothetical protein n=1 Tax=Pseudomonas sp. MBLB4123 TaxID=3451557 RepID=UPI003F7545C3
MTTRLLLCLLLCLALPLNGLAALAVQAEPCPMPAQAHEASMQAGADCCDAQKSAQLGSKVCKNGQQCQSAGLPQLTPGRTPFAAADAAAPSHYSDLIPLLSPEDPWRPPRA